MQDSRARVQSWLDALDLTVPVTEESTAREAQEPPAKRARTDGAASKSP